MDAHSLLIYGILLLLLGVAAKVVGAIIGMARWALMAAGVGCLLGAFFLAVVRPA